MAKSEPKSAAGGSGAKRKPKLGQNFLTDHSAAQRIVDALGDISNRTVIEIGPGRGMLTDLLVRRATQSHRHRAGSHSGGADAHAVRHLQQCRDSGI